MAVLRPNRGASAYGRAVLCKHLNFKTEYSLSGAVDMTSGAAYTDTDGGSWALTGNASASEFGLTAAGLKIERTTSGVSAIRYNALQSIPGLHPLDRLVMIFKIEDIAAAADTGVYVTMKRHATKQSGGWHLYNDGANKVEPYLLSNAVEVNILDLDALSDRLIAIDCAGLTYGIRSQAASADFPTVIPDDVALASGTGFAGYWSGDGGSTPDVDGVIVADIAGRVALESAGNTGSVVLSEFWLFRME